MCRIKGLRRYIKKHGRHLTEELAKNAIFFFWTPEEIMSSSQRKVYYNVTGATVGDMVYLANYNKGIYESKNKSTSKMLSVISNYKEGREVAFDLFIDKIRKDKNRFNLMPYI